MSRAVKILVTYVIDSHRVLGNALVNSLYENCINFYVVLYNLISFFF